MDITYRDLHFETAMLAIKTSYNTDTSVEVFTNVTVDEYEKLLGIADKLANKDGGHNKFLEHIPVSLIIRAPRYWWQEEATYRVITNSSQSTMHTITKRPLEQSDFARPILDSYLDYLNKMITDGAELEEIKNALPEGFMQIRILQTNYKALRNMYHQRKNHKLSWWREFCEFLRTLPHSDWITKEAVCSAQKMEPN